MEQSAQCNEQAELLDAIGGLGTACGNLHAFLDVDTEATQIAIKDIEAHLQHVTQARESLSALLGKEHSNTPNQGRMAVTMKELDQTQALLRSLETSSEEAQDILDVSCVKIRLVTTMTEIWQKWIQEETNVQQTT